MHRQLHFFSLNTLIGLLIALLLIGIWLLQDSVSPIAFMEGTAAALHSFWIDFLKNLKQPLSMLILQLIVIVSFTKVLEFFCRKIWQPAVVAQIIAGILLGPSLMGYFFPAFSHFLFNPESLSYLKLFSDFGLILFMFIAGMELDLKALGKKAPQILIIGKMGMIIPFSFGSVLAVFLYQFYAGENTAFLPFVLFISIAMSITAFPVLVCILQERGIIKTHAGELALSCAALEDIIAWCLLAGVIAITTASSLGIAILSVLILICYIVFMLKIMRPIAKDLSKHYIASKTLHKTIVAAFFVVMLLSAYLTNIIGVHSVFGAFMAGLIMPHDVTFKKYFIEKIEDVSLVLLVPIFFVFSGLNTQINLIDQWMDWLFCLLVIIVAILGKFGGCTLTAWAIGENWKDSLSIGVLMNTRGLMELIVLNIGYDMGILNAEIFSIFVLMAVATTFLTNPLLNVIDLFFENRKIK